MAPRGDRKQRSPTGGVSRRQRTEKCNARRTAPTAGQGEAEKRRKSQKVSPTQPKPELTGNRSPKRAATGNSDQSSAEAQRMKARLIHLTGSNIIHVNDKDYMEKLRVKIWQEYEAELKRKEAEREDNERQRMRRLLVRGVIGPEQLREDRVLWREYKTRTNLYDKQYRGKHRQKSPQRQTDNNSARAKSAPQARQQVKRVGLRLPPSPDGSTEKANKDRGALSPIYRRPVTSFSTYSDTFRTFEVDESKEISNESRVTSPRRDQSASSSVSSGDQTKESKPERRPSEDRAPSGTRRKYEPPIIQEMRREETVAGLYRLAEIACHNEP